MKKQIVFVVLLALTTFGQATPPPKYLIGDWPEAWHPRYPKHRFQLNPGAPTYLEVITKIETQRAIAERDRLANLYRQQALIDAQQAQQPESSSANNSIGMAR